MNSNYYQGRPNHPWHLSVGAVLVNDKKEVGVHYFKEVTYKDETFIDFYILMKETIEPGETIEQALTRGLMEEFGAEGSPRTYVGSLNVEVPHPKFVMDKTTLYFLVDLKNQDVSKRLKEDPESVSEIQWCSIDFLIPKMKEQAVRLGRKDSDESLVLERVKNILDE